MNIAHWLARSARVYPGNPAVSQGSRVVFDYAQLAQRVSALAAGLRQQLALQPGDRVALVMTNSPFYVELLYAAWWGGLTAVPVNAKLHHEEAAYILDHSGAKVCFVSADLAADIGALEGRTGQLARVIEAGYADYHALLQWDDATQPFPVRPDDAAWLFYTSGTTGRPKGVTISHRNIIAMSLCYFADVDQIGAGDCVLHAAPMSHGSGMYNFPHVLRAANQVIPEHPHFDPGEIFALCKTFRGVAMFAAPTMVSRLVAYAREHRPALDGLKTIIYGGGPMYLEDIKQALAVLGERLVQIYGQGECPMPSRRCRAVTSQIARICDGKSVWRQSVLRNRRSRSLSPTTTMYRCSLARSARCWCAAMSSCRVTGPIRKRVRKRCATAGCIPETSAASTPMVSSRCAIARRI